MNNEKKLLYIFIFSFCLMVFEVAGGLVSHSLALLSDAGHMFTDTIAVLLSYLAIKWSQRPANDKKTFGYHRIEIIVALVNGVALLFVSGYIFYEAIYRFFHPQEIKTGVLLVVAGIGLAGNIVSVILLHKESKASLNIKGAFIHILGDTLSSVGVIAGGLVILFTGWNVVDSLVGILIGGIVLRSTINLIFESTDILLESTPKDIDLNLLKSEAEKIPGVKEFHEVHVWTITSNKRALSGHVLIDNINTRDSQKILCEIKALLVARFNISHSTLEVECDRCAENACEFTEDK
jgi:cobalt-zinc-cadmium efflux system protein